MASFHEITFRTDAIMGVSLFASLSPEEFGAFDRSFVTMFRLLSGEAWVYGIPLVDPHGSVNMKVGYPTWSFSKYACLLNISSMVEMYTLCKLFWC